MKPGIHVFLLGLLLTGLGYLFGFHDGNRGAVVAVWNQHECQKWCIQEAHARGSLELVGTWTTEGCECGLFTTPAEMPLCAR